MNQQTMITETEYSVVKKHTRREKFLETMNKIVPWKRLCELIAPYYYNNKVGRPAIGIETMLRMYLLQIWYGPFGRVDRGRNIRQSGDVCVC